MGRGKMKPIKALWVPQHTDHDAVDHMVAQLISAGYFVVVYYSGKADLTDQTCQLLNANIDAE